MIWVVSESSPFIPVLRISALEGNLAAGGRTAARNVFVPGQCVRYLCAVYGRRHVAGPVVARGASARIWLFPVVAVGVLLIRPLTSKHALSLEAVAGVMAGTLIYLVTGGYHEARQTCFRCCCWFPVRRLRTGARSGNLSPFIWVPFYARRSAADFLR